MLRIYKDTKGTGFDFGSETYVTISRLLQTTGKDQNTQSRRRGGTQIDPPRNLAALITSGNTSTIKPINVIGASLVSGTLVNANTATLTVPAPAAGNICVILFTSSPVTGTTARTISSLTQTNVTWSAAKTSSGNNGIHAAIWVGSVAAGAGTSLVLNTTAACNGTYVYYEFSGSSVTVVSSGSGSGSFTTSCAVTAGSQTAGNLLLFATGYASNDNASVAWNGDIGTALRVKTSAGESGYHGYVMNTTKASTTMTVSGITSMPASIGAWAQLQVATPASSSSGAPTTVRLSWDDVNGMQKAKKYAVYYTYSGGISQPTLLSEVDMSPMGITLPSTNSGQVYTFWVQPQTDTGQVLSLEYCPTIAITIP